MIKRLKLFWYGSITRQLLLGISLTHAVLMSIFIFDLVDKQHDFLKLQNKEQAIALAETLAANSASWLISQDFVGIEEVIESQHHFPNIKYAMLLDLQNKVLGHSLRDNVGLFASDEVSRRLLTFQTGPVILFEDDLLVDVAVHIYINKQAIGWARVGLDRSNIATSVEVISSKGVIYTTIAILVGIVFAWFTAKGLTLAINQMSQKAKSIREGERNVNFRLNRPDELGRLSLDIDKTVKHLAEIERQLETYHSHMQELVEQKTNELVTANQELIASQSAIELKNNKLEAAYYELKVLQKKLIETEKLASLGSLVTGIAHEINTPIGIAHTAATALQNEIIELDYIVSEGKVTKQQLKEKIDKLRQGLLLIINNHIRAIRLTNDFKQVASVSNCHRTTFYIKEHIEKVLIQFRAQCDHQNIHLHCECSEKVFLFGDVDQFSNLFEQLISNVIEHGFDSQDVKQISISVSEVINGVAINFSDNGVGMDEQQVKHIFDPFYTTQIGKGSGGLGMYIAYNIITQAYLGSIECSAVLGKGTAFNISLFNYTEQ